MNRHTRRLLVQIVAGTIFLAGCGGSSGFASLAGASTQDPQLAAPPGFTVDVFERGLQGPRYMAVAPNGDLLVALTYMSHVVAIHGANSTPVVVARGLNLPHGLAFDGSTLYIATWDGVEKLTYPGGSLSTVISGFPENGDHDHRALALAQDHSLYVSIGSSCNVCADQPPLATIQHVRGASASTFASGLRNASGLAFDSAGRLWATVNQRDDIGPTQAVTDNLPPDELDLIEQGGDYGWPACYPDPDGRKRDPNPESPNADCSRTVPVSLNFPAHSAPLGIVFYDRTQFPKEYRGGAFVAFHGSWNRTTPTGDKVVYVAFANGKPTGYKNFLTGWLRDGRYLGRPSGLAVDGSGDLFVSDDQAGIIYRIRYAP
ncbi:MAG TPA: PQQ-dependent sugar dehydrogenase [Candidatus Eremiobacteraceae bacterium]|nr:PQQ-dependent sugar dehydrogenase [Candidatus Eremiobacteraceae bacterium]